MSQIVELIKHHEGLRLKPYRDTVGKWTIGYGRNLDDIGISEIEARLLLEHDVSRIESAIGKAIPSFHTLGQVRQDVLLDMAYNLGINGLLKFKKMLAALESYDWKKAAEEMLDSKWANQVGQRAITLAYMMELGIYC